MEDKSAAKETQAPNSDQNCAKDSEKDQGDDWDQNNLHELTADKRAHQRRMSILAKAPRQALVKAWQTLDMDPGCELLRGPETGLLALRGRIGGGGAPFNFGEATITRATIRMDNGAIGHAIMLGRDVAKAKLAAVIDALATDAATADLIEEKILSPLEQKAKEEDAQKAAETQATRVNFFTMVRGEG